MRTLLLALLAPVALATFDADIKPLLTRYCLDCHGSKKVKGKVDFSKIETAADVEAAYELWETVAEVVGHGDMPPDDEELLPTDAERATFATWFQHRFVDSVEARPGHFRPRRLSAAEFENTIESLMGFELAVNVSPTEETVIETSLVQKLFPPDPPGASGFKNDTANTQLTPVLLDLYAAVAEAALGELFTAKRREQLERLSGPVDGEFSQENAETMLRNFLPRAHRRPVPEIELQSVGDLRVELKAALLSPRFLYRGLLMPLEGAGVQPVDSHELAERLSYFIWASMPDEALFAAAEAGSIDIEAQVTRMLQAPRASALSEVFVAEWMGLEELDNVGSKNPAHKTAIVQQPRMFADYLFRENRPLLELIDSKVAFVNPALGGFYDGKDRKAIKPGPKRPGVERRHIPLQRIRLSHSPDRGGIITMPGVLMMNRGPVNRGTWILERIIGDHLPEPPDDIGQVPNNKRGQKLSFRERFEMHRAKPTCAICHDKIDPLGFALDAYDNGGRRIKGKTPIDTSGQLPSGETFENFEELMVIMRTSQRRPIIRNIVERLLSYGLARKLTVYDRPVLEEITDQFVDGGGYGDLIRVIATSKLFTHTVVEADE